MRLKISGFRISNFSSISDRCFDADAVKRHSALSAAGLRRRTRTAQRTLAQTAQVARIPANPRTLQRKCSPDQVDGIAVRIEDDILTESELRELAAFQQLVDGASKNRGELIGELTDQWIVRTEADAAKYPQPSAADVDRAFAQLQKQFPSPGEFQKRFASGGLSDAAVRWQLALQLYLSRFIDYRFRPATQVGDDKIEAYYNDEFVPQLKARKETVPALDDVEDTIREVLVQREITERAQQWLTESHGRLSIDVTPHGGGL